MKLSLAVTLHLALLATAAPLSLRARQDAPGADDDVTAKIAYGSLKSAAQMMNTFNSDASDSSSSNNPAPDFGNNMVPNSEMTFPKSEKDAKAKPKAPTPVEEDEEEEESVASPAAAASATVPVIPSAAAASSSTRPPPPPAADDDEDAAADPELKKKPAAEAEAAATPAAAPKKPESPLSGLPLIGGLLGGL
ncbi:hypothetical protein BJY04DRAFT_219839 [Aspergillus karnatakaensis]|uniref:uncharacterized protein n=1 Tax=Aspergillus karnatakaensis TaxID=1810916 RepID=UPI003CCD42B0